LSQKQLNRSHILDRLVNVPSYTIAEAAEASGLSERQVKRLKGEYKEKGINALVHKNIGSSPVARRAHNPKQTSTTANIYSHAIRTADEMVADTLQEILSPNNAVRVRSAG